MFVKKAMGQQGMGYDGKELFPPESEKRNTKPIPEKAMCHILAVQIQVGYLVVRS